MKKTMILVALLTVVTFAVAFAVACGDDGQGATDGGTGSDASSDASSDAGTIPDAGAPPEVAFVVVDTGLDTCYRLNNAVEVTCPTEGAPFYGQNGNYEANPASYATATDGDVVIDQHTGLMWEKAHHATRLSYADATAACESLSLGGFDDWRVPSIKELFSLSNFKGTVGGEFYLDAAAFDLEIPTDLELTGTHSYEMMGQTWSSTTRPDNPGGGYYFFNFLDGHIKSGLTVDVGNFEYFYRCVRGDPAVFENDFADNGDGTVTDQATGLIWQQDNGEQAPDDYQFEWEDALSYCANLDLGGATDWRLPHVKELQSIVDYTRSEPSLDTTALGFTQTADTAAFFWSSTSMLNYPNWAIYVCFAECTSVTGTDIHGPGAQRADPKKDEGMTFPDGVGDQQDVVQIHNYVRCVR